MIIAKNKIPFVPLLVFSFIVLSLYLAIRVTDFQFVKNIIPIETNNNLPDKNLPKYINLYIKSILYVFLTGIVSFILAFIISPEKNLQKIFKKYLVWVMVFFFFSYIVIFQILKFKSFHCYADLAVPLQVLHNIISGNGPISSLEESFHGYDNWFSAHFSPIIYPIAAIFSLFPRVETIIILQTLGITLTCIPLYWYANKLLKNELASLFAVMAFFFYPPIHYIALYEFEYLKFAIPFLAFTFYFLYRKKYYLYFWFFILSLCSREDVSLVTFALGIYIIFIRKEIKVGIVTSVVSIAYFLILIVYIMPSLRGGQAAFQLGHYGHLGTNLKEIILTVFCKPLLIIKYLFSPLKIINFILYTLPVFFFSFFSPSIFFIALPNILTSFLTRSNVHFTIFLYHLSPTIPFIFLSYVNGINNIALFICKKRLQNNTDAISSQAINPRRRDIVISLTFTVLVIGILSQYFFGPSPLSRQFWDKQYTLADFYTHNFHFSNYQINEHHSITNEIIKLIPMEAIVSAEQPLLPHLCDRKKLYVFPIVGDDTEYILIDKRHKVKSDVGGGGDFRTRPQFYYEQIEENTQEWKLLKEKDGVCLFMKLPKA